MLLRKGIGAEVRFRHTPARHARDQGGTRDEAERDENEKNTNTQNG